MSFDLRIDLHKALKMLPIVRDKNIYILIEEALGKYLNESNLMRSSMLLSWVVQPSNVSIVQFGRQLLLV